MGADAVRLYAVNNRGKSALKSERFAGSMTCLQTGGEFTVRKILNAGSFMRFGLRSARTTGLRICQFTFCILNFTLIKVKGDHIGSPNEGAEWSKPLPIQIKTEVGSTR